MPHPPNLASSSGGSARVETSTRVRTGEGYNSEGVTGLKALGVRDLNYRLAFLAGSVQTSKALVSCTGWGGLRCKIYAFVEFLIKISCP